MSICFKRRIRLIEVAPVAAGLVGSSLSAVGPIGRVWAPINGRHGCGDVLVAPSTVCFGGNRTEGSESPFTGRSIRRCLRRNSSGTEGAGKEKGECLHLCWRSRFQSDSDSALR